MKKINLIAFDCPVDIHKEIKRIALEYNITMRAYLLRIIIEAIAKQKSYE